MNKLNKKALLLTTCVLGAAAFFSTSAQAQQYAQQMPSAMSSANQSGASSYSSASSFFAPIGDRIVSDPMFLPLKGQIYGVSAYTGTIGNSSAYNHLGVKTSNSSSYSNTFSQTLAYGISDDVTIRLAQSYEFGNTDSESLKTGATTPYNNAGLTDPTLSVTYRFIDQRQNYPVSADLYAAYSPNMLTSRNASATRTGTEDSGRQTATFQADVGREMNNFTVEGLVGGTFNGRRNFVTLSNDQNDTLGSFWSYFAAINTQTRITDRLSFNGNVRYTVQDKAAGANQSTGLTWIQSNPDNVDFTVDLNYQFIPNRLVGQLSYDNVMYTHTSYNYSVAADSSQVRNQDNNIIGARLMYLFN